MSVPPEDQEPEDREAFANAAADDGSGEDAFDAAIDVEDDEADDAFVDSMFDSPDSEGGVDLKADQRAAIDLAWQGVEDKSFYEILLLPRSADAKAIKRAYYRLSKEYHPDKFYRKNLGGYKAKLELIFNKITEAYRVLSDVDARADYDSLMFGAPEPEAAPGAEDASAPEAAGVSQASTTVDFVPEAEKRRQAKLKARRAAAAEKRKKQSRPVFMQNFQKELAERIAKARRAMKAGQQAMDEQRWGEAASNFQMAMTLDPRNTRAKALFKRAQGQARNMKAEAFYKKAQDALLAQDAKRAAEELQKAVDCKPTRGKYYYEFGKLIMEHTLQQKTGLELLRKSVELEPRNVDYCLELGKTYEEMGMPSNAVRVYERVVQVDKKNSIATKALKRLK